MYRDVSPYRENLLPSSTMKIPNKSLNSTLVSSPFPHFNELAVPRNDVLFTGIKV